MNNNNDKNNNLTKYSLPAVKKIANQIITSFLIKFWNWDKV